MVGLWLLLTSYCRLVWQIAWFLTRLIRGVDQNDYRIYEIHKRGDRTTKEREYRLPPTPSIWVLPSPYLALSHIQIRMWFVCLWADRQIHKTIIHKITNMSCETVINKIGIFVLAHVFHLFQKAPDKVYAAGKLVIVKPSTRGRWIRFLMLSFFLGIQVFIHQQPELSKEQQETELALQSLKNELHEPSYAFPT